MKTSTRNNLKPSERQLPQPRTLSQSTNGLSAADGAGIALEAAAGDKTSRMATANFEIVLEAIRHRQETKTAILEEALQRSEQAQQRFWGINE